MTRRTTGGSVRHHANRDLWEARHTGADGRRHSVCAKGEREVQAKLRTALQAADHGSRPIGNQLTTAAFLEDWLTTSVRQRCRTRTAESYAATVRLYVVPAVGSHPTGQTRTRTRRPHASRAHGPRHSLGAPHARALQPATGADQRRRAADAPSDSHSRPSSHWRRTASARRLCRCPVRSS